MGISTLFHLWPYLTEKLAINWVVLPEFTISSTPSIYNQWLYIFPCGNAAELFGYIFISDF